MSAEYIKILNSNIDFGVALKVYPTKGNLVYEYNPLRNYRITETTYYYKNRLFTPKELLIELGVTSLPDGTEDGKNIEEAENSECISYLSTFTNWDKFNIPQSETDPILIEPGQLADFETNELNFDINHPVDILPQYSYDNSVNLILNDGKNNPRLINTRFSATSKNQYQIVDRKGNNDTNIYDQGSQFDIDTSLYKRVVEIPKLRFIGTGSAGRLPVGNYHFYFRYADADGNETDFVAESGLVSVFIGNTPQSIRSGFRDEDSHKSVQFLLTNIDSAYQYVNVYYTRSTSDINENAVVKAVKIDQKFIVNNFLKCEIIITGFEDTTEITTTEINPLYQIANSVETQTSCQNMLFLGNIQKPEIPYQEFEDISLRFLPTLNTDEDYKLEIDKDYNVASLELGYYDSKYIYDKVGYWNHEIYRLGIVYIMSNGQLSPVFNIRGAENIDSETKYSTIPFTNKNDKRNYIITEEDTYKIVTDASQYGEGIDKIDPSGKQFENAKGVISILHNIDKTNPKQKVYGINIKVDKEVLNYLKNMLKIKGFFFVRQKRIPTTLCQAYTIGIDKESRTPVIPIGEKEYIAERFIDNNKILTHDFESRKYKFTEPSKVRTEAAICPEYDVDSPYYNSIFTGDDFTIQESDVQYKNDWLESQNDRNFSPENTLKDGKNSSYNVKIIGVEDNVKLVAINNKMFSARAGEAEEAHRYEYLENENKVTEATNLIRGSFGPYLGITGYPYSGRLIDIKIPGFNKTTTENLFKIRYNDKDPFYAISERIALNDIEYWFKEDENNYSLKSPLYRGDCYICQFTHRINRNFQDPQSPINDKIVDSKCWKENYEVTDGVLKVENFDKINLGDVNAIKLGMWITFTVRSSKNLNIRAVDSSIVDEISMTGHPRGFYPYHPISAEGAYKTPEALCYNKGFQKALSERYNFEEPDVPAIKNDFTNRISYSDIHVNDAFKNGFRVFQESHYRDYPKTYGSITKLVELRGTLLCVFEHGIALIPVNERAVAGEGTGGNVYINTSNVLPENPKIISDTFGSQWKDSVIKTPTAVYGVDTIGKKIWRTNGENFECISDFKVQEFLNKNISLSERENVPIIGVRNVKTHYNKFKHDVMFTFYDNLYDFEEKAWNLCYNEQLQKWITFYSWIPSYSENIYNQYFSFDRNTSKWISKLGISHANNDFSDGVVLSENTIPNNAKSGDIIGKLDLANRTLPEGNGISVSITYEIDRDAFGNYKLFEIDNSKDGSYLKLKTDAINLCSELYQRIFNNTIKIDDLSDEVQKKTWENGCVYQSYFKIDKDEQGRFKELKDKYNASQIVRMINIKANISVTYNGQTPELGEAYKSGFENNVEVDAGYYKSSVAVITEYNKQFLSTNFWKHGQAGIIDQSTKPNPCYWYDKQHPFEFEFVVADNPSMHKIFDNLQIISNNAEPESFHYEVVGDCYDFANDKQNMYIRQEATKELYQYNGSDITYDHDYTKLNSEHRYNYVIKNGQKINLDSYGKSTLLPLYYQRRDSINEIEDFYDSKTAPNKDYSALSGGEIVKSNDEYHIWNHAKAVDISNPVYGRIRGNMQYKEDEWDVQINPLNIVQKNESEWLNSNGDSTNKIPVELNQNPLPSDVLTTSLETPKDFGDRWYVTWNWEESQMKEAKIKDKWVKIRIRYSGNKLAIITAIRTLYSISYS